MNARQAAAALRDYKDNVPIAILRGLRRGLRNAQRLVLTRYMERKDNRGSRFDPANPPPGPLGIRSGNLARSVRIGEDRWTGRKIIGSLLAGDGTVRYARIHEYGGFAGRRRVYIPARPYLTPALRDPDAQVEECITDELRKLAQASLRGLAREAS